MVCGYQREMSCMSLGVVYCLASTMGKVLEICIHYIPDAPSGMLKLMVSPVSQMKIKAFSYSIPWTW